MHVSVVTQAYSFIFGSHRRILWEITLGKWEEMARKLSMDGATTPRAYVSRIKAFTEVAGIYPITPSFNGRLCWPVVSPGCKEYLLVQQSRLSRCPRLAQLVLFTVLLGSGALTTTYTASQALLMLPNMYKIAGEQLPGASRQHVPLQLHALIWSGARKTN